VNVVDQQLDLTDDPVGLQFRSLVLTMSNMNGVQDSARESPERCVHHSSLAGTWYPADKDALVAELDSCLARAPDRSLENICGLILPHAGYHWSGPTAAHGVKLLPPGRWDRVVVLGPSHHLPMENQAGVPLETHYATPLGEIPLDQEFIRALRESSVFATQRPTQREEHSVQIELPLLQRVLGAFSLVPIVIGQLDKATVATIAVILQRLVDARTLVIASSDFTHYGWRFGFVPFQDQVPERIEALDLGAFDFLRAKDVQGFLDYTDRTGATICGRYPISILLSMLPAEAEAHRLHYDTSGRASGDFSSSVSYMAVAFTGKWSGVCRSTGATADAVLAHDEQRQLLRLAREALAYAVRHGSKPTAGDLGVNPSAALSARSGAFVTLRRQGQLRGCIGEIYPTRPLYQAVMEQAVNAGLNDRRFSPVSSEELQEITIEVSVLTPPKAVRSSGDIRIGTHGIVLRKGGRSAVFLPKVAVEQGWDLEDTLNHLARKAGLSADAWRAGAAFEVFEVLVIDEPSAGELPDAMEDR
jgi:AmmeMemoRadiSam system protein B/AmmeMemoRadiSam system protein A